MATAAEDDITSTAAATIELLESRLRRIEFLLTGDASWTGEPTWLSPPPVVAKESVTARLAALEYDLKRLAAQVPPVQDVLELRVFINFHYIFKEFYLLALLTEGPALDARFPDLFQTVSSGTTIPTTLSTQSLAAIVLAYASAFPETASRLTSLQDLPIPPASASTSLIELQPRLDRLAHIQEQQAAELAELRTRSALVIKRWVEVGIVGGGELWAEWEGRVERVERGVRRAEGRVKRNQEA